MSEQFSTKESVSSGAVNNTDDSEDSSYDAVVEDPQELECENNSSEDDNANVEYIEERNHQDMHDSSDEDDTFSMTPDTSPEKTKV